MKRIIICVLFAIGLLPAATGVAFLKIPVDASICGNGEAAAASVTSAAALYYNPAGISRIGSFDAVLMHNQWFLDMRHEYVAAGFGSPLLGAFAASFNYWTAGDIQGITWRGDTIPGYVFSASDWNVALGYGRGFGPLAFGASAGFVRETNESLAFSAWAFGAGALYDLPVTGLRAGASVTNVGAKVSLDQDQASLPWTVRAGWRYDRSIFGVTQDFIVSADEKPGIAVGAECRLVELLALRLGYRTGSDMVGFAHLRAGLGVRFRGIGVDYAFAPYGKLGLTHRISLSYHGQAGEFGE